MKSKVDYNILGKFFDYEKDELEFDEVIKSTSDLDVDLDNAIEVIFNHYRKHGFPHYTIREDEKHKHMRKLRKFDHTTIIDGDKLIQTMHALRLAWSFFEPHFWNVRCGNSKMTAWEIFHNDEKLKKVIRKTWRWQRKWGGGKFTENRFRQIGRASRRERV